MGDCESQEFEAQPDGKNPGTFSGNARKQEEMWDELALRFLDGDNSDEVRKLLSNPRFRKLLAAYAVDAAHLLEFGGRMESCLPNKLKQNSVDPPTDRCDRPSLPRTEAASSNRRLARFAMLSAAATAVAATLLLALLLSDRSVRNTSPDAIGARSDFTLCAVEAVVGDVHINGEPAIESVSLGAGQGVSTSGALSSVRLIFSDNSTVQLAGDTSARIHTADGQKLVYLDHGHAAASIRPQRLGKPLMLYTSNAELEVVGTEFAVSALSDTTKLSVSKGVVLMKPRGGGEPMAVRDGEFSEVRLAKILPPYQNVSTPSLWREDFDDGLPDGWVQGTWVKDDAQDPTGGAVAPSLEAASGEGETVKNSQPSEFTVRSHDRWANGLMRVHDDSQLTYRIKMERPEWYQVFLCVRAEPIQDGEWSWNYEYQEASSVAWKDVEPGAWRTLTIPLRQFKRQVSGPPREYYEPFELRTGEPPPVGGLAVWIMFTSQGEDRGMVIDDISIARASTATGAPVDAPNER